MELGKRYINCIAEMHEIDVIQTAPDKLSLIYHHHCIAPMKASEQKFPV
jgi:hypothetical protein